MDPASTLELVLTRLWYLIGEWEGTGKGPDFRFRARATYSWVLNDRFLMGYLQIYDLGSDQVLSAEHSNYYYDYDLSCLVGDTFCHNGMVEHALGHADARGRMVLTTDRLQCHPRGTPTCRLRRTIWMMAAPQWAFTLEKDPGQGFVPYLEGQMRRLG